MMTKAEAESRWCPFALPESDVQECSFSGDWRDTNIFGLVSVYQTQGKMVAATVVNRTSSGDPHPKALCISDRCVWWRKLSGTDGDCSKLDDNMNARSTEPDSEMEGQWCPNARPENTPVKGSWSGNISGCTIAITSANRSSSGGPHAGSKCITSKCMAYSTNGEKGYCMDADRNMQR